MVFGSILGGFWGRLGVKFGMFLKLFCVLVSLAFPSLSFFEEWSLLVFSRVFEELSFPAKRKAQRNAKRKAKRKTKRKAKKKAKRKNIKKATRKTRRKTKRKTKKESRHRLFHR